ncbi:helix-turn-helix domain-containing protein [Streptomyces sp. NPDC005930]|uniref:helix-turn-helix domain-containing protein n=1 Tax=Streptomyces sp. NPDC005930 TaxID=3364736 RepID=UPI0036837C2D
MTSHVPNEVRVIPLRPQAARPGTRAAAPPVPPERRPPTVREPLWRDLVGDVLRRERLGQERTLKEVAEAARISMPYLSEVERGRKEASSEVLAAAAGALGLGLADLLARAQGELIRLTSRHTGAGEAARTGRGASGARFDGMCLAA